MDDQSRSEEEPRHPCYHKIWKCVGYDCGSIMREEYGILNFDGYHGTLCHECEEFHCARHWTMNRVEAIGLFDDDYYLCDNCFQKRNEGVK